MTINFYVVLYPGVVAVLAMLLIASIIITVVTFAYYRQKLHHRNQETPQGIVIMFHVCFFGISINITKITYIQLQFMRSRMTGLYLDYHRQSLRWNNVLLMEC